MSGSLPSKTSYRDAENQGRSVTETQIDAAVAGETARFDRPVDDHVVATQANSLSRRLPRRLGGKRPKIPAAPLLDTALLEIDLARLQ